MIPCVNAPKRGHKSRGAAAACRYCSIKVTFGKAGDLPVITSATPKPGTVHDESGLAFSTGKAVRSARHNVGQTWELPSSMEASVWRGTWLDNVTIREGKHWATRLAFKDYRGAYGGTLLHLRDCTVEGDVHMTLNAGSTINGLDCKTVNRRSAMIELEGFRDSATARPVVARNIRNAGTITVAGNGSELHDSTARTIRVDTGDGSVITGSTAADRWYVVGRQGHIVIDKPGQWLIVHPKWRGTIEQKEPALITVAQFNYDGRIAYDETMPAAQQGEIEHFIHHSDHLRASLARRPEDGSKGRYLHPHNDKAWNMLLNGGMISTTTVSSNSLYGDDKTVCTVSERALEIALRISRN